LRLSCEKVQKLMVPWLENELGNADSDQVSEHIETCSECEQLAAGLSSLELEMPDSFQALSMSTEQQQRLDDRLLSEFGADEAQLIDDEYHADEREEDVLSFPHQRAVLEESQRKDRKRKSLALEEEPFSKERLLMAALILCFFWGFYQSTQVEQLQAVIEQQEQTLERMESAMQLRPSSPAPYIMTVSHVPRRMEL
jgi:hypothetical protein